jgi:4-hydroxy-tetrahydrodipicolinate synthase
MINQTLYTASVTPFTNGGEKIDYISLERLLRIQEKAGNGLVIFGSTGEGLSISLQEKRKALEFICSLKLNTQIIVGVPSHNFTEALEWINFCNDLHIEGYLMTAPIYTKPGILGQTRWFEALLNAAKHGAILYNIPSRAGVKLHTETVQNLSEHPQFMAIKDSSGTVESIVDYQIVAQNIAIYCGDDYLMPAMAAEGAVGLISVASNAWPKAVREYVKTSLNGKGEYGADKIWWKACRALFAASNPIPIKALLKEIGLIENDIVRLPLFREDLGSLNELISCHALVNLLEGECDEQ